MFAIEPRLCLVECALFRTDDQVVLAAAHVFLDFRLVCAFVELAQVPALLFGLDFLLGARFWIIQ